MIRLACSSERPREKVKYNCNTCLLMPVTENMRKWEIQMERLHAMEMMLKFKAKSLEFLLYHFVSVTFNC